MEQVDQYIAQAPDWQRHNLDLFRRLVHDNVPGLTEDFKWNVPVFMVNGKVWFAMSVFKEHTKYNFMANGAELDDPAKLFNNGLDSKKSRGIDLREGETIDESALAALIRTSVA